MATIAAPRPLILKNALLRIDADDYQKHVSGVTLTPSASTITWASLSPDAQFSDISTATWAATLNIVQDWSQPDSLCRYLFEHEGEHVSAVFQPLNGEGPAFAVTLILTPGAVGGEVNSVATQSVTLGVEGRPTIVEDFDPTVTP